MNIILRKYTKYLNASDIIALAFLIFLIMVFLTHNVRIPNWYILIVLNLFLVFGISASIKKYELSLANSGSTEDNYRSVWKIIRYWYGLAAILISFKEVYHIVHSLGLNDWDLLLIKADFALFGTNPTMWAFKFANPYLTEVLQTVYVYYYPMILVFGLEIYLKKKYNAYKYVMLVLFAGFFISYALYLVFPANGPRFHLHDFYSISKDLPGIFLTDPIRTFLNFGESIPAGVPNPQDYVQRDAMPSLHTTIALIVAYLSWKLRSKSFYFYLPYYFAMAASTIYLRYHYVVDIFAGIVVTLIAVAIGELYLKQNKNYLNT